MSLAEKMASGHELGLDLGGQLGALDRVHYNDTCIYSAQENWMGIVGMLTLLLSRLEVAQRSVVRVLRV